MSDGFAYVSEGVYVLRDEEQGVYKFGLMLDGAYVVFGVRKIGGVDDQIATAKAQTIVDAVQPPPTPDAQPTTTATVVDAPPPAPDQNPAQPATL